MESVATLPDANAVLYDPARITPLMVDEIFLWAVNNTAAWYIQNPYLMPADMDSGAGCLRVSVPLTVDHIRRHLIGQHTMGCYAINPKNNCCKWFALDADYIGSEHDLTEIANEMIKDGLHPAVEHSRRGGHIWLFCERPIPARMGRIYLYNLLDGMGLPIRGARGAKEGVEVFPKQESLEEGQLGNGLKLFFGVHRKSYKRYWFKDASPELEAQFAYLRKLPRLTEDLLAEKIHGMDMPEDLKPPRLELAPGVTPHARTFDIRLFVPIPGGSLRKSVFVQCPSCAEGGRDRSKNNLHITPVAGQPPLFHCFAGCPTEAVKSACHRLAGSHPGRRSG